MCLGGRGAMRRDNSVNPHSNALREHRVNLPGHIYHLVKCLDTGLHRQVDLTNPAYAEIITDALFHQRDREGCYAPRPPSNLPLPNHARSNLPCHLECALDHNQSVENAHSPFLTGLASI